MDEGENTDNEAKPRTIRFQLLLAVNLTLGVALAVLLGLRYQREMAESVADKHAGLVDEAIAIHQAVFHILGEHRQSDVQRYLESVCARMRESRSPGHQIVVHGGGIAYQAGVQHPDPAQLIRAMEQAAFSEDHRATLGTETLVVGSDVRNGVAVHVAESMTDIRRAIRGEVFAELTVLALLGVVAAGIVNLVLLRIVDRPLNRLIRTVEGIARGELGVQAPRARSQKMDRLVRSINVMSSALEGHDRQRRRQMEKARQIQEHLHPNGVQIPGLRSAHLFRPAEGVAGDYYDFLPSAGGGWLICIADVTGHGIPAAMGAAMLKALLLTVAEGECISPAVVLHAINQRFTKVVFPGHFASMFVAHWAPETCELTYANAGHPPPLTITAAGRLDTLSSTGLLLGVEPDVVWQDHSVQLGAGDRLLLFSDGATESRSPKGEMLGRERLAAWFSRYSDLPLQETLDRLAQSLSEHRGGGPPEDDLTLVLIQCAAEP